jgi:hypothetical protein
MNDKPQNPEDAIADLSPKVYENSVECEGKISAITYISDDGQSFGYMSMWAMNKKYFGDGDTVEEAVMDLVESIDQKTSHYEPNCPDRLIDSSTRPEDNQEVVAFAERRTIRGSYDEGKQSVEYFDGSIGSPPGWRDFDWDDVVGWLPLDLEDLYE